MGTDIHSVAQIRDEDGFYTVRRDIGDNPRDYNLFGILADVRNGSGFAGCDLGEGFVPVGKQKGLPEDFKVDGNEDHVLPNLVPSGDPDFLEDNKDDPEELLKVWMGDHSYSWHTLAELKKYIEMFGNNKTKQRGYVTEELYLQLKGTNNEPKDCCGGIAGKEIVSLTANEYEIRKLRNCLPDDKKIYVQYEWITYYKDEENFLKIIQELENLAQEFEVTDEEIRFVFGFDS